MYIIGCDRMRYTLDKSCTNSRKRIYKPCAKRSFSAKMAVPHFRLYLFALSFASLDILVSFVNMKLRDEYESLEQLCEDLGLTPEELCQNLRNAGYEYSPEAKRFW